MNKPKGTKKNFENYYIKIIIETEFSLLECHSTAQGLKHYHEVISLFNRTFEMH